MPDNIIESIISDIQNKNYSAAIERLDELIDKNPSNHDLYEIKAGCNYALGNFENAVDDWTYAIINFKNAVDHKKELSVIYGKRGRTYLKAGNYLNASEDFNKSLVLFPNSAETLNNLATCMRRVKNYEEALISANKAIELNPDFSDAYNNRANINYCLGNTEDALSDYSSAIKNNPGNPKAYFNRGSLYYYLRDEVNARKDWEKAISIDEDIRQELSILHPEFSLDKESVKEIPEEIPVFPGEVISVTDDKNSEEKIEQADEIIPEEPLAIHEEPEVKPEEPEVKPEEPETIHEEPEVKPEEPEAKPEEPEVIPKEPEVIPEEPEVIPEVPEVIPEEPEVKPEEPDVKPEELELKPEEPEEKTEEFSIESFHDVFEKKESDWMPPSSEKSGFIPDINIPDLDFKNIFMENQAEEIPEEQNEEPVIHKPLISDEVQKLHEEIESAEYPETDELKGFKGFTMDMDSGSGSSKDEIKHIVHDYEEQKVRKRLEFFSSPVFLVIIILAILVVVFTALYQIIGINRQESGIDNITGSKDTEAVKSGQTSDSLNGKTEDSASVTKEEETISENETVEEVKETVPEETPPPVKETVQQETVSKTLGFISDKKKFILLAENDGYYVQVGSYKEKSKAEEIVKELSGKGIKASVIEADLKEKGIYYRVRAGAFTDSDEAKQKMSGLE